MIPGAACEQVTDLGEGCRLRWFYPFCPAAAEARMKELLSEVAFEQRTIVLFGKEVLQPRVIGWGGDLPYTYSRRTLQPRPMGEALCALLGETVALTKVPFNHALLNLYRDGSDSMGMHSDDEAELGTNPSVASWSFGATRTFRLAQKKGPQRFRFELRSGTLLVMEGATQHEFRHGLPKDEKVCEPRLNVTFRRVLERRSAR